MERYVCIHGHFYQPPRENPWLEEIEIQDSAYPYHDWNKRITAECYAPNSASRILDGNGRILDIVGNYSKISFNFGPTLLTWMETHAPETYQAILLADRQSMETRSGHGNAIAQVYNHIIMPLANSRDKKTQILWGIKDFEHRFKRFPEGMWLSETAVDVETLRLLAGFGIRFVVLAPHQAARARKIGTGKWKNIEGGRIDPTRVYLMRFASGYTINIFFYDGPISRAVAFEDILTRGEDLAQRILSGFSEERNWPQILSIATDGETYGHHSRFGDMALAYALHYIENNNLARLTNFGEYLEQHPPTHEVQIIENTSWSCVHGIERWRSNCGCNSGGYPEWNQSWRAPLRRALDELRDRLVSEYENMAGRYLREPWQARDDYIALMLDSSPENGERFFDKFKKQSLEDDKKIIIRKLLEIQRHTMLMYTSCGWFFDEVSGIETTQILQYAGRAIQLWEEISGEDLREYFFKNLVEAKSNIPEHGDGVEIFRKFVQPVMIDFKRVGSHYAVNSIFEDYPEISTIYSYDVIKEDYKSLEVGMAKLAIGRILIRSRKTTETEQISFCVLYIGDHALNGGVRTFMSDEAYRLMNEEISSAYEKGEFLEILRRMDHHFGMHNYSLRDLFRDQQRKILNLILVSASEKFETSYRQVYDNNKSLMSYIHESGIPVPKAFFATAEFILNVDMEKLFMSEEIDLEKVEQVTKEMKKWNVPTDSIKMEFIIRRRIENMMEKLHKNTFNTDLPLKIRSTLYTINSLMININYWHIQNIYYEMMKTVYKEHAENSKSGNTESNKMLEVFKEIGEILFFSPGAIPQASGSNDG